MPVPKRKRSRARRDKRFANKGIKVLAFTECQNCKNPLVPHVACSFCGFYKGIKVMNTKMDRTLKRTEVRSAKKAREKQAAPVQEQTPPVEKK